MYQQRLGRGLVGAILLVASPGRAQEEPALLPSAGDVALEYVLGPGASVCPDEQAFRDAVAAEPKMRGADPFVTAGTTASFRWRVEIARVKASGGRGAFEAVLTLYDREGTQRGRRNWSAKSCDEAVSSVAFTLGGAIEPAPAPPPELHPSRTAIPEPAPPLADVPPAPPPRVVLESPPAMPLPSKRRPRVQIQIAGGTLVAGDFAPDVAIGFAGSIGIRIPWLAPVLSVSLEGRGDLEAGRRAVIGGSDYAISTSFVGGSLLPCVHTRWLAGCGLLVLGAVRGTITSSAATEERAAFYAGAGVRGGLEAPVSDLFRLGGPRLILQLTGDFLANVTQPGIVISNEIAWHVAPVSEVVALRVVTIF